MTKRVPQEDSKAYNAGAVHDALDELIGSVEQERLGRSPQWMRLLVNDLVRRIVNLRAQLADGEKAEK